MKSLILSNGIKKILYNSDCWVGKTHDYRMLTEEFPPTEGWFKNFCIRVDLAFLGLMEDYDCKKLLLPFKKKKNQELSEEQKKENQALAKERVVVEHAIGGMKRYRMLSGRLRMHDIELYNRMLGVCAGLWNFYISH